MSKGRAMGTFAEDAAPRISVHPRAAGRLCDREPAPRQRGDHQRQVQEGDRAGHGRQPQGRGHGRHRRAAGQGQSGEDSAAEARLREGRHDHRGDLFVDHRRRRGAGADPRRASREKARQEPIARIVATRRARAGAGAVHRRARSAAIQKVLDKAGWSVDDVDLWEVNEASPASR